MKYIVEVQNLTKVFDPNIRAVDGISFQVEEGEVFGFLGPNGAGKSTTIKILTTLLRRSSGRAKVAGMDVEREPAKIRKLIGYSAQDVSVDDDLTARENLRLECMFHHLHKADAEKRIRDLLREVDLEGAADRPARTYSGGMKKRLDLACALIHRPKLLFLDEPTTGLDPQNRSHLWDYIKSLNDEGTTIFLTTQYMEEADRLADRLSIVDLGKIVAEGTPASLKAEIGADVVTLGLRNNGEPSDRVRARDILQTIPGVREVKDVDGGLMVYAKDGPTVVPEIVRSLDGVRVQISQLSLAAPSLNDVFLKYTGRKMRVEEVKPIGRTMYGRRRGM